MGCGCSKNKNFRSRNVIRPAAATNNANLLNSSQLRAQSLNNTGLTAEKRKTQALRRAAIRKAFNK